MKASLCFVALLSVLFAPSECLVEEAVDIIKLTFDIGQHVLESWEFISKHIDESKGVDLPVVQRMQRKILSRIGEVSRKVSALDLKVDISTATTLSTLLLRLPQTTRLELRLNELSDLITRIKIAERQMQEYVENQQSIERLTLENFAEWAVSHEPGAIPGLVERIHALIVPDGSGLLDRGMLQLIVTSMKETNADLCNLQQSPNQLLYNMYNSIALTEIKGYAMMQFSWMLLKIYGKGNFTQEASLMKNRYDKRSTTTITAVKAAMREASRAMWKCDPQYHEEGETFAALKRLLQGYVENEVDMNSEGTCKENCAYYSLAKNHGCFKDQWCSRQATCSGKILSCQYIDSDMWICPATRASDRRYEWIEYENGRTLGKKGTCLRGESKVDSWWRWLFWHCSYCFCFCDQEDRNSHRYFSLQDVISNIDNNKVVTGLRLNKVDGVIHLQLNEGTLLPHGNIDQSSMRWIPITPIDVRSPAFINGVDYHTMSSGERAMDLDDLNGDEGTVMTGVRFKKIGGHMNMEIMSTPFNFTTGKLTKEKSAWISNDNTDAATSKPRKQLMLQNPDIPTRSPSPSTVDSQHDQYLEFTHSDINADAAQTTVPYLDIQPVLPSVPIPLTGAGIYHKGMPGFGGFVGVKVFTFDYTKHMQAGVPGEVIN